MASAATIQVQVLLYQDYGSFFLLFSESPAIRPKEEHLAIAKRRKQQKTKTWLKQYSQRAGVEGTISQGVRGFGLRKCRYIGLNKAHLQHLLTATAMNVIRLFAWFEGVPLAKTRVSSFAKLAPD